MNIFEIPSKISFSGESDAEIGVQLLFSKSIYNLFKTFSGWDHVYKDYQNLHTQDVASVVNADVGDNLLNNSLKLYTRILTSQMPPSSYGNASNNLGFLHCSPIFINRDNAITAISSKKGTQYYFRSAAVREASLRGITQYQLEDNNFYCDDSLGPDSFYASIYADGTSPCEANFIIFNPDDIDGTIWKSTAVHFVRVRVTITLSVEASGWYVTRIRILGGYNSQFNTVNFKTGFLRNFNGQDDGSGAKDIDTSNPYTDGDNAGPGGGDGENPPDTIDPTAVPDPPNISAVGMVSIYNPSAAQIESLADFLWSGAFDLDTYKKLYVDPMQCLIGLSILPCVPSSLGTKHIKFGNVDTNITSSYCSSQFATVDCGSVKIDPKAKSFMDYSPYTKVTLFLPFCNAVKLDVDEIMNDSISVKYNVDVLSGDCIAFVSSNNKGVLYSFPGNCKCSIPLTSQNYSEYLRSYNQGFLNVVPSMIGGGSWGGAQGAAVNGVSGLFNAGTNAVMNCKPIIQHSGGMSGGGAIMGIKKPFIIIERPNISVPANVEHYIGQTSNMTAYLGSLSGFTAVEYVHLDHIDATAAELKEIENMLKAGVVL